MSSEARNYIVTKIEGFPFRWHGGSGDMEPEYVDITAAERIGSGLEYEFRVDSKQARNYYIGQELSVSHASGCPGCSAGPGEPCVDNFTPED